MNSERQYVQPLDPEVAKMFDTLSDVGKCFWSERAAILEFDGGFTRTEAEAMALLETLRWLQNRSGKQ